MSKTPKSAYVVSALSAVPVWLVWILAPGHWREMVYLALLGFIGSIFAHKWLRHRQAARIPMQAPPAPELILAAEHLPKVAWLAIGPPAFAAVVLWYATSDHVQWLQPWIEGSVRFKYQSVVVGTIAWNSLALWVVVYSLAVWYGMPRAYEFRRELIQMTVGNQWAVFLVSTAWLCAMSFDMPDFIAVLLACAVPLSLIALFKNYPKLNAVFEAHSSVGSWFYVDSKDPTFLGLRGMNLANRWTWVLAGLGIAPFAIAEWLLLWAPK